MSDMSFLEDLFKSTDNCYKTHFSLIKLSKYVCLSNQSVKEGINKTNEVSMPFEITFTRI